MRYKVQRILAACDGSPGSEEAFAAMMPIVRADNPEVTVVYVFNGPNTSYFPPAHLSKVCDGLRSSGVDAHLVLREGHAAEEILKLADQRKPDLIAMSTHGRSGLSRAVLGSVAEEVVRRADVPVLVTRPGTAVKDWNRLLVALDGSARSEEILQDVIPLAWRPHVAVELIRAVLPPITMTGLGEIPGVVVRDDPMPYLRKVKADLAEDGVEAEVTALVGRAAFAILDHAEKSGASLLCMTTHGRTGFERILMGSVAEEVLRHAPCPVLVRRSIRVDGLAFAPAAAPASKERS